MRIYTFIVPCSYKYEIVGETEEQAKQTLLVKAGVDLSGVLLLEEDDYINAECVEESEVK